VDMRDEDPQFNGFEGPEASLGANDSPPSWVSSIVKLLTQFLKIQQTGTTRNSRPRHSQPHPEKFSGIDPSEYPQFRSLLEAKLKIDGEAIGNEEERVWYGFGRLSDTASRRLHPWIEYVKGTESFTVNNFLIRLDKAFSDPEKISKAIDRLNSIKQGNQPFREFLQEFEQLLLEARGWGWEDPVKKGYLKAALNRELSDRLVSQSEPVGYEEFVSQLRVTSDKADKMKTWDSRKGRNHGINPYPSPVADTQ
ncbi:hypothetical protein K3495_g16649, partial [Podosphaera aphanis]